MNKEILDKLVEGFHRCGEHCACQCGCVYNREGICIISKKGRHHPVCICHIKPVEREAAVELGRMQ